MLVLIDESGCPAEAASKAITDLRQTLSVNPEFKFSKTHPTVKDKFFDELCQYDFEVRALVVDKSNIYSQKLRNDTDSFYNYFVKMLMQYDDDVLQNASIKIDGSGDKEFKKALTAYLRQRIGEHKIKNSNLPIQEKIT